MQGLHSSVSPTAPSNGVRSRLSPSASPIGLKMGNDRQEELSIWIRLGIPLSLALVAAVLNAVAVRSQIQPTYAFAFASDLPAGTRLRAEHLTQVELAGGMDRGFLVLPNNLLIQTNDHGQLSLEHSLEQQPRFLTKPMGKGELLSVACLGGSEDLRPRTNEGLVMAQRSQISGDGSGLMPGQIVHFLVTRQKSHGEPSRVIGPFRIGLQELDSRNGSNVSDDPRRSVVPIVFLFNNDVPTPMSQELLDAINQNLKLTVIHKSIQK
jgi:hypothetical protein